jgi:hypothetical protein
MKTSEICRRPFLNAAVLMSLLTACQSEPTQEQAQKNTENEPPLIQQAAFFQPLSVESNVPFATYEIDANRDTMLVYSNGSKLFVPANAFADGKGKTVSGKISINYREMHNPYEILLAGIPMAVKNNATDGQLESAGMLEVTARQNGETLQLATNQKIKVEMVSEQKDDNYNLYRLDTTSRQWTETVQNLPVTEQKAAMKSNPAIEKINKQLEQKKAAKAKELPIKPQTAQQNKFQFHLKIDLSAYPEMNVYDGIEWEFVDNDGSKDPRKNPWVETATWLQMRLEPTPKKGVYTLNLSNNSQKYSAKVRPVFDAADVADAQALYDEKYKGYTAYVAKLEAEAQKRKEALENKKNTDNAVTQVSRVFEINQLGVWNCDRIVSDPQTAAIAKATFQIDGNACEPSKVYLIDQQVNSVYYAYELPKVNFNPSHKNLLLVVSKKGEIGVLSPKMFGKLTASAPAYTFQLKKLDAKFTSAEDLQKQLAKMM